MKLRQYDVFANPSPNTRARHPYFIVLQSDWLDPLGTRLVAPLATPSRAKLFERLLPEVTVEGHRYAIIMPEIGPIPVAAMAKPIANLEDERYRIATAIDLVFTGN